MSDIFDDEEFVSGFTPEQEKAIIDAWNASKEPSIKEIGEKVFGPGFSQTSQIGKKLKRFIASRNTKSPEPAPPEIILTEGQQLSILQNVSRLTNTLDLAQFIFPGIQVTREGQEFLAVQKFISNNRSLVKEVPGKESVSYKAPKKPEEAIAKVNLSTYGTLTKERLEKESNIRANLTALVRFLNSYRFSLEYESYKTDTERKLFETTFIKYTFDKPDLTEEEVDQYINLSREITNMIGLKRELEYVAGLRDALAEDSDGKKMSVAMVDSMAGLRKEMDDSLKRQNILSTSLKGKRSDRIDTKIKENASVLQIVESWRTAEKRARMIKLAEEIKVREKKELVQLDSIEAFKGELWGLNPESYDYTPQESSVVQEAPNPE